MLLSMCSSGRPIGYGRTISTSVIEELRLTAFKSFRDARLPLGALTLLIGRNGVGKSNALDGLEVLSRLCSGEDLRDALEGGRRDIGPVRGGAEGCAPAKTARFGLGCSVRTGDELVTLDESDPERAEIEATWWNGKPGRNPTVPFRASQLLTSQVPTRVPTTSKAGRTDKEAFDELQSLLSARSPNTNTLAWRSSARRSAT